nr:hypothetical protein [Pseudomonas caspiana]
MTCPQSQRIGFSDGIFDSRCRDMPYHFRRVRISQDGKIQQTNPPILLQLDDRLPSRRNAGEARYVEILQTFHLAVDLDASTPQEKIELDAGSMREDPKELLNLWFQNALPMLEQEIGVDEIAKSEARLIGVFMLVAMKSLTTGEPLRDYLRRFNG